MTTNAYNPGYAPGDVANGFVLQADGTWAVQPAAVVQPTKPDSLNKLAIALSTGGVILLLIFGGLIASSVNAGSKPGLTQSEVATARAAIDDMENRIDTIHQYGKMAQVWMDPYVAMLNMGAEFNLIGSTASGMQFKNDPTATNLTKDIATAAYAAADSIDRGNYSAATSSADRVRSLVPALKTHVNSFNNA